MMMKKKYIIPCVDIIAVATHSHILESSYIDAGGKGGFDVKEADWHIWSNEEDEE